MTILACHARRAAAAAIALVASLAALPASARTTLDGPPEGATPSKPPKEHFRMGVVSSVGFPRPLTVGAMMKIERAVSLGVEWGTLPATRVVGIDLRYQSFAADLRIFPLQTSFYLGLRAGRQRVEGSSTVTIGSFSPTTYSMSADTFFVNPRIGFLYTGSSGLSVGIEAGVQFVTQSRRTDDLPKGVPAPETLATIVDTLGTKTLPTVSLLQLGLLF